MAFHAAQTVTMLALAAAMTHLPPRSCHWPRGGDSLSCGSIDIATTISTSLCDIDGAMVGDLSEISNDNRTNFLVNLVPKTKQDSLHCFMLHVNFHLGSERVLAVCDGDDPDVLSEWICDSDDACFLRRFDRLLMRQHVAEGVKRFKEALEKKRVSGKGVPYYISRQEISVPYILIGDPPSDKFKADVSHLDKCTSCWMTGAAPNVGTEGLEAGVRNHLLADSHAILTMHNLERKTEVPDAFF